MGFPRLLVTDEMTLYVLSNFEWYCREVAFPSLPLPSDYEELYSGFVLAEVEEYAWHYKVPELPQVVFLEMLLNDAVKLGILCGWMIEIMESALKELQCSTFQAWVGSWMPADRRYSATQKRRRARDYWDLCPSFTLPNAEKAARDFNIPEIIQSTFYAMLRNDAVELSLVSRDMIRGLKSTLEGLRWTVFESWLSLASMPS
ncbi:hypothetical protein Cgig2_010003 [Carnegiea gigantea]|uniref:Uncharacterized protein n=1 Tax=Carnegiea gigantea TaxID=171969 RepID=A0A9Q1JW47_9CARY|nr:hypothetical protein Cgig2_010003 [Carnegiea gigantea]